MAGAAGGPIRSHGREAAPQSTLIVLWRAMRDLGWFWGLFSAVVGGPSVLALLQMVFVEHRLSDALQWIVDGYNDIVAVLGAVFEPLMRPVLAWLNAAFAWRLELHPHWRPLFMLAAVPVTSYVRSTADIVGRVKAAFELLVFGFGALLGAMLAGLAPLAGGWWAQGLAAAAPIGLVFLFATMPVVLDERPYGMAKLFSTLAQVLAVALIVAAIVFGLGAGVSFIPGVSAGAGILVLGLGVMIVGALGVLEGLRNPKGNALRLGLISLGGFAAAAIILGADAAVKALGGT